MLTNMSMIWPIRGTSVLEKIRIDYNNDPEFLDDSFEAEREPPVRLRSATEQRTPEPISS